METSSKEAVETNPKILSSLMLVILFVSMGQSVYWQTMPIIGREFQFTEIEINTLVSISAAMDRPVESRLRADAQGVRGGRAKWRAGA